MQGLEWVQGNQESGGAGSGWDLGGSAGVCILAILARETGNEFDERG